MTRSARAFIAHPYGPSQPVQNLKFAVVDTENMLVSAVWTIFPAHNASKPDIYVTASGIGSTAKFSFHKDVLNHSILPNVYDVLVQRGVVNTPSRHQQRLPIPALPWHGLTVRLVPEFLRKKGHSADHHNGTIVALPIPPTGMVLEVGFILAEGKGLNVQGAQAVIGHVVSGGRALAIVMACRELDTEAHQAEITRLIASVPPLAGVNAEIDPSADLAAMLYGEEQGFLTVTEVHNLRYRPPVVGSP